MMREPTPKQATRMLAALTNLQVDRAQDREIAGLDAGQSDGSTYKWESEALARLRWYLIGYLGAEPTVFPDLAERATHEREEDAREPLDRTEDTQSFRDAMQDAGRGSLNRG